ncbi:MAG: sigma-54-dependent transcriptional regulator [Myxococcota bacterium]
MASILIVDDDRSIRRTLEKFLTEQHYQVDTAEDGQQALERIRLGAPDVVLLDINMPNLDGLEVLRQMKTREQRIPTIVVSARGDMRTTIQAIQEGAYDFLNKPLDIEKLKITLKRALEQARLTRNLQHLVAEAATDFQMDNIIGSSPAIREVFKAIGAVSTTRATVLITGESGTGKELVARAIHYNSPERDQPFVAVNCSAFSASLLESELFGHVKGAFTGATAEKDGRFKLAGQGTLFLDEVGELSLELQVKLLRVLQERSFERVGDGRPLPLQARIVAATNCDLLNMIEENAFREDFYYRLKVMEIQLPPLRDRRDDIPLLVEHLLAKINRTLHKRVRYVPEEAMRRIQAYDWPGNIRELENTLTRAVVLTKGEVLDPGSLPLPGLVELKKAAQAQEEELVRLKDVEKAHIIKMLHRTGWNKRQTCMLLDITRPTLDKKIKDYGLVPEGGAQPDESDEEG